jgi:polar amino acid transport system substrate-binding protein
MQVIARVTSFNRLVGTTIEIICALSGSATAESLRIVTEESVSDNSDPGLPVEIVRQVFASMGEDASIEFVPLNRVWRMVLGGEADGIRARQTGRLRAISKTS